jgi:hypothetical protein
MAANNNVKAHNVQPKPTGGGAHKLSQYGLRKQISKPKTPYNLGGSPDEEQPSEENVKSSNSAHGLSLPTTLFTTPEASDDDSDIEFPQTTGGSAGFNSPLTPPPIISASSSPIIPVNQSKLYPALSSSSQSSSQSSRSHPRPPKKTSCYDLLDVLLELGKTLLKPDSQPLNTNRQQTSRAPVVGPSMQAVPAVVPVMPIPVKPSMQQNTWPMSPPHIDYSTDRPEDFKLQQFQYLQPITKIEYRSIISANVALAIIFTLMIFIFWNAGHTAPTINEAELGSLIAQIMKARNGHEKIDFACAGHGGTIEMAMTSDTYRPSIPFSIKSLFYPFVSPAKGPQTVISPNIVMPGDCWPMNSTHGFVTVKLAIPINVTSISYHHIEYSRILDIKSTPQNIKMYGLNEASDLKTMLGSFKYDIKSAPGGIQEFKLQKPSPVFRYIQFEIDGNYGSQQFTCLYRFGVHSELK